MNEQIGGDSPSLNIEPGGVPALSYYQAGFPVIPIIPSTKRTALKWGPWLGALCEESIRRYWRKHPDYGVGFIVPEDMIVFDADSPMAVAALYQIEESFDIASRLIVKTKRGEHHYFRLAPGTKVKTCSIDTAKFPHGIDIKANRSMVILP
jgi:hypothetical protein